MAMQQMTTPTRSSPTTRRTTEEIVASRRRSLPETGASRIVSPPSSAIVAVTERARFSLVLEQARATPTRPTPRQSEIAFRYVVKRESQIDIATELEVALATVSRDWSRLVRGLFVLRGEKAREQLLKAYEALS